MRAVEALVLLIAAVFPTLAWAEDFSLPERYWPNGFAWEEHHYSGWTGASVFRPGRTDPTEFPVLQFSTPGIPSANRIGGRIHETPEYAAEFQARVTRKGPVASSIPDAECHEGWSNEGIDGGILWSSGLQFNCRIGRMTFYVDLRSQSNRDNTQSGNVMLNEAVPLAVLHEVSTSIVAGFRQYAVDNGLLDPIDRITAALFPNPEEELPNGYWWAKSAGAVYEIHGRPQPQAGSWTPSWLQTIEVSAAPGYVFKPNGSDGSGSWCRPEKNGKCDLSFQRVTINIQDFMMHGGQDTCLKSLESMLQGVGNVSRVSDAKLSIRGRDPDQYGLNFCRNGFFVSVNTVGEWEPAVPAVAEYYTAIVERRIGSGGGSLPSGDNATIPTVPGEGAPQPPGGDMTGIDQPSTNPSGNYPTGYPADGASRFPVSPVSIAAGTLAAGGIAGLGAWLMLGQAGLGRREMLDAVADLARGRMPSDGFDEWKARYEAMGWTYREENGVAVFDPPPGYTGQTSTPPPVTERHRDGETNPDTGEVWSDEDGGWVGRNLYDQEKRRAGDIAAIEERNRQAVAEWDAETQALDSAIASSARDRAARAAAEEAARTRIGDKLSRLLEADGISTEEVERMRREHDTVGLEDLYERTLRKRMAKTSAEAAAYNREAAIYRAGELGAKVVLAGAKASMMAVTGPAGYIPALVGSGVLRSAEEGATAYVRSDGDKRALGTALVSGFFAGAKDGVVGRFTGLPRTGNVTKVVLPAAADAGETYIRTGDIKATMTTGLMSAAGGASGSRMDRFGSTVAREAGQAATGATMGAVNAAVNGGSIADGAMDGMADAVGGRMGQHVGADLTPMTRKEIQMDLEYKAKLADARNRIDAFDKAVASGDPAKIKPALQDVLEHREAKVLLKRKDVDPGLKTSFAELTQEHRTKPVMDGTADALNRQTVSGPDGVEQPRFVMRDDNGVERPVTGADFASGSGKPGEPGVDLDMYPKGTIIDKATGRPARAADVDQAVSESCAKLGIDRRSQEVNVTGMKGTEDITMRPGETPEQFYARAGREGTVSAAEGTGAAEVGTHKLHAADELHGDGVGSSALAEKTRGVMKDKGRLIDPLIAGDGRAQIPEVFRRMEPVKRASAMDVLQQLADGSIPPGTANAKFRQLTNMDIDQALPKIAGWSEGLGKWGSGSPGSAPAGPSFTGAGGASNLQQVAAAFIRNMDATKTTE